MYSTPTVELICLYRFYGRRRFHLVGRRRLLYIGISNLLPTRISQHEDQKPWWRHVQTVRVEQLPAGFSRDQAKALEAEAIQMEGPQFNKLHNLGRFDQLAFDRAEEVRHQLTTRIDLWCRVMWVRSTRAAVTTVQTMTVATIAVAVVIAIAR